MEWDRLIDEFLQRHTDNLPGVLGDLVARCILAGCEVDWHRYRSGSRRKAKFLQPGWLPTVADRLGPVFIAVAHGWYCNPLDPPEGEHGRDFTWIHDRSVWLQWPDVETGWHWLLPMPHSLPLCDQIIMAEQLFDGLPGDVDANMNLIDANGSLDVTMQRRGAETTARVTRGGKDRRVQTTARMGGPLRHCFMQAVAAATDYLETPTSLAH